MYKDLDHEINPPDAEVWTAKTTLIRFTTVEMHHSDHVKLQFGMSQGIPDPPTCLGQWHLLRVADQWGLNDLRDFVKNQCCQWRHRRELVLRELILQDDLKPTL